jgi:hypothetical protein
MKTVITFSLVLHMLLFGILLGLRGRAVSPRLFAAVFLWMLSFHVGAGILLSRHLDIVDPRNDS